MNTKVGILSVTACLCFYFSAPKVQACVASTNYCEFSKAVSVSEANIVPTPDERIQPANDKDFLGAVVFFVIVLAAFAYIIYQLIKMMDKIIPPPEKKPDPPPHSSNTNITIVMNPTHGPGPVLSDYSKTFLIDSNTPSWGPVQCYDIRDLNYENDCEKFPTRVNYDGFWSVGMTRTTDMIHWEDSHYRVDCYVCSGLGAVCYAYFHYGTNFWNCYYTSAYVTTNHAAPAWFNLSDEYKPAQFFRLDPK
jgi:hypothetical protein